MSLPLSFVTKKLSEFVKHLRDDYIIPRPDSGQVLQELAELQLKRRIRMMYQSYNYDALCDNKAYLDMLTYQLPPELQDELDLGLNQDQDLKPDIGLDPESGEDSEDSGIPFHQWMETKPTPTDRIPDTHEGIPDMSDSYIPKLLLEIEPNTGINSRIHFSLPLTLPASIVPETHDFELV